MGFSTRLTAAFLLFLYPLSGFSELVCERPDGCRWIGSTCQDCIERPPPKPQLKVPSEIPPNSFEKALDKALRVWYTISENEKGNYES